MAGRDASKGAVAYELEASWAENVAFSSPVRVPVLERVNLAGLKRGKLEPANVTQLLNEGVQYIPGPFDNATFELVFYLAGHGSATTGATTATILVNLLKLIFGYAPSAPAGTTISGVWTTTSGNVTASGTFPAGWLVFFGAPRDGRAGGNVGLVASHSGNVLTLLNALPATVPTSAGPDAVHSSEVVHFPSSPADAQMVIPSTRWLLQTADQQITARGCFPTAAAIENLGHGEPPRIRITMQASYFTASSTTFPSALSTDVFTPAVNAAGQGTQLQVKATTTRAMVDWRLMSIDLGLGVAPVRGTGGVWDDQTIVAARRIPAPILFNFTEDAESATATPARQTQWESGSWFTLVGALNLRAGKRVAFAAPNLCFTDLTLQDLESGLNVTRFQLRAHDDPAGGTELTKSAFRIALG